MWSAEVQRHDKIYNDPLEEVMMFKKWLGVSESESRREGRTGPGTRSHVLESWRWFHLTRVR